MRTGTIGIAAAAALLAFATLAGASGGDDGREHEREAYARDDEHEKRHDDGRRDEEEEREREDEGDEEESRRGGKGHGGRGEGPRASARVQGASAPVHGVQEAYAKECGACHLAYPPRLLPASSWRAIMGGLERHFSQDTSLEPEVRDGIEAWLVARAGRERRGGPAEPPLRITGLAWFRDEHDEVPAGVTARPAVRTMANCAACHSGAEAWDFDEDRVKIPR